MSQTTSRTSTTYSTTTISSSSTRPSRRLWDPRIILGIDSDPRCSGTTKRGTRCGNTMISRADRQEASVLLKDMARMPPEEGIPLDMLIDLAGLTLCPRWHRKPGYSQVDHLAYDWERMIDAYIATTIQNPSIGGPGRRLTRTQSRFTTTAQTTTTLVETQTAPLTYEQIRDLVRTRRPSPAQNASPSSTRQLNAQRNAPQPGIVTSTVPSPRTRPVELPGLNTRFTVASRTSRGVDPRPRVLPTSSTSMATDSVPRTPAPSTVARSTTSLSSPTASAPWWPSPREVSTSDSPTPSSTSPSSGATPADTPTTPTTDAGTTPTSAALLSSANQQQPLLPLDSPPSSPPHVHHPGLRQPLTADSTCPICFESITSSTTSTYCRAQCGSNVHRECFDEWRDTCFSRYEAGEGIHEGDTLSPTQRRGKLDSVTCVYCRSIWQWEWWELMNERQAAGR